MSNEQSARRELIFGWAATVIACIYCAWLAITLWRHAAAFGAIFRSLNYELSSGLRFVVEHGWICPVAFGSLALFAVLKEWVMRDKRLSVMISFLIMMLGHWVATIVSELYQQPLLEMMRRIQ